MSKIKDRLTCFLEGPLYPVFVGVTVLLSHIFALEAICAPIVVGSCMLVLILCGSAESALAPIILFTYLLSREHSPTTPSYSDFLLSPIPLSIIITMCVGLLCSIVYFFVKDRKYRRIKLSGEPAFLTLLLFVLTLFI